MSQPVVHMYRVIRRRCHLVTTTLCGRMSNRGVEEGNYSTADTSKVTCKFCQKRLTKPVETMDALSAELARVGGAS